MEGMIILYALLAVIAIIIIAASIYAIKNKSNESTIEETDSTNETLISSDNNEKSEEIEAVVSAKIVRKNRGGIWGLIGFILTLLCWLILILSSNQETNIASAIIAHSIKNPVNLIGIATLLSFFGLCFHDASCILLAAVALVASFIMEISIFFVLLPAIILMFSYIRMKKNVSLRIEKETLH